MPRYHVVKWSPPGTSGLVEGIPSEDKPDDSSKDNKDGWPIITGTNGPGGSFWERVLAAGYVWTGTFKRYWEHNPAAAEKIRNATETA